MGYLGSVLFFITNHIEEMTGVFLSLVMIIGSIGVQRWKVVALKNEERRKEERHRQDMQQDQEEHELKIKNQHNADATKN